MKKLKFFLSLTMMLLISCSPTIMRVSLNPEVPEDIKATTIPFKVALFMDSKIENYHFTKHLTKELSDLDYNIGQATSSLFLEAFMNCSRGVVLIKDKHEEKAKNADIILKPEIVSFSETHPPVLTIGKYTADITYRITIFDKNGKVILEKNYTGHGFAKGERTHNPGDNYAKPVEIAMKNALKKIINDLKRLNLK